MNRSNKGFGLVGVLATVIFLIVAAIFSASAKSAPAVTLDNCCGADNINITASLSPNHK
jgi:hypothetical protein